MPLLRKSLRRSNLVGEGGPQRAEHLLAEARDLLPGGGRRDPGDVHPQVQGIAPRALERVEIESTRGAWGKVWQAASKKKLRQWL